MTLRSILSATALALAAALATGAHATTITFDELAAQNGGGTISNQYAGSGVTFSAGNLGTWGGNSNGDPGGWKLEGTNGPQFLGFNGNGGGVDGYTETLTFSAAVGTFSADFARSAGSNDGEIILSAFNGATLVATSSGSFGALAEWMSLSIAGVTFDSVTWSGSGTDFHPYGVDNVVFGAAQGGVPEPAAWALMLVGFGGLGVALRRRRAPVAVANA